MIGSFRALVCRAYGCERIRSRHNKCGRCYNTYIVRIRAKRQLYVLGKKRRSRFELNDTVSRTTTDSPYRVEGRNAARCVREYIRVLAAHRRIFVYLHFKERKSLLE